MLKTLLNHFQFDYPKNDKIKESLIYEDKLFVKKRVWTVKIKKFEYKTEALHSYKRLTGVKLSSSFDRHNFYFAKIQQRAKLVPSYHESNFDWYYINLLQVKYYLEGFGLLKLYEELEELVIENRNLEESLKDYFINQKQGGL